MTRTRPSRGCRTAAPGRALALGVLLCCACDPPIPRLANLVPLPRDAADELFLPRPDAGEQPDTRTGDGGAIVPVAPDPGFPDFPSPDCGIPAEVPPAARAAYTRMHALRAAAALPCLEVDLRIARAAELHCAYFSTNAHRPDCVANPHRQVAACPGFTGARFSERLAAAGYPGPPAFEVMAYTGHGAAAVRLWLDSVWHRIPLLAPEVATMGFGSTADCDTMDFGLAASVPRNAVITYPLGGQRDVPLQFDGNEAPPPPPPPQGWPSGYPVSLHAPGVRIDQHSFTADDGVELPHTFLAPGDPRAHDLLVDEHFLYAHRPLQPGTRYRVRLAGRRAGLPVEYTWSFTTRAAR